MKRLLQLLALAVLAGLAVTIHRQPRGERFGPDCLQMRLLFLLYCPI